MILQVVLEVIVKKIAAEGALDMVHMPPRRVIQRQLRHNRDRDDRKTVEWN